MHRLTAYLIFIWFAWAGCLTFAAETNKLTARASRPNVLLILADDLGYADLHINNSSMDSPTPNLDRLAESGIRFTRHYAESTCSPSRAALLTGRYPSRIHFRPNGLGIPIELVTLPKAFRAAGYTTHQIGKWHLGHLVPEAWPDAQGFDTWLGFLNQWLMTDPDREAGFHYGKPTHLNAFLQNEHGKIKQYQGHLTDVVSDEAISLITEKKGETPWFIYAAYFAPHEPMEPRADYAARFSDTFAGRYSALVAHLDDRVGDLLKALDATGQRKNTIVIFASDNGGTNHYMNNNAPFLGKKTEYLEGGIRTPLLISWPGRITPKQTSADVASIMDIFPSVATLAGIQVPKGLDGKTLLTHSGHLTKSPRTLFWDTSGNGNRMYSVLTADGRWRLLQDWLGAPSLFDLNEDPSSSQNVAAAHADVVVDLQHKFDVWVTSLARIKLHMMQRDSDGHGILIGDQLQRAATFDDATVAVGVVPKQLSRTAQVIIEQRSMTRITLRDAGLNIQFHGLDMLLPPLPINRCSSLIITGTLNRKIEVADFGPASISIFVNGRLINSIKKEIPFLESTKIQNPTYIGMSEGGSQRFMGWLSEPIYLNRRVDIDSPPSLTVDSLSKHVCASAKNRI